MDTVMKDIVGTPFVVGDKVATDTMAYRSSELRVGTVTAAEEKRPGLLLVKVSYLVRESKRSVWRKPNGVVKVASC